VASFGIDGTFKIGRRSRSRGRRRRRRRRRSRRRNRRRNRRRRRSRWRRRNRGFGGRNFFSAQSRPKIIDSFRLPKNFQKDFRRIFLFPKIV